MCRAVAGHDYFGHGGPERGGQAGHHQGQAHPTHPPVQGEANTSDVNASVGDPEPDPLVKGADPDLDPSLFS